MKRTLLTLMAALLVCGSFLTLPTFAQEQQTPGKRTPGINEEQREQKRRIRRGVRKGELTKSEAQKLRAEQKSIEAQKKAAKANGSVTKSERQQIKQSQRNASKDIHQEKDDNEKKSQ